MSKADFLKKLPLSAPSVHCIGIGGIGVSAIAELLLKGGFAVSGSDIELNKNCQHLQKAGAEIAPAGHRVENLPATCAGAVATAAANMNNPEISALLKRGVMVWHRGEFLGELCRCYQRPVLVAGSHGKSSISAMLGWILLQMDCAPGLLIGARYQDSTTNAAPGNGDILVAEADESDGSHALLYGELALISNIDGDHAWNAEQLRKQEKEFTFFARQSRCCIYIDSAKTNALLGNYPNCRALTGEKLRYLESLAPESMLGYERVNAALALAAAEYLQLDVALAAETLKSYPGIGRRQCVVARSADDKVVVIEDYAHHPTEVAASLEVIVRRSQNRNVTVVFQPHRSKRLQHYFKEFVEVFSRFKFNLLILPVFSAWEHEIDAPTSNDLAQAVNAAGGRAEAVGSDFPRLAEKLLSLVNVSPERQIIALIGAGDIDKLTGFLSAALLQ